MDEWVVGEGAERAHPGVVARHPFMRGDDEEIALHVPLLDRSLPGHVPGLGVVDAAIDVREGGDRERLRHLRHLVLVVHASGRVLERRAHRQDRLAVLEGVHPPGREGATVTHPLHPEGDGLGVIAGPHEVGVQRVQSPLRHGCGRDGSPGMALQRIYPSPGKPIDVCTEVGSRDVVIMPFGYHGPSVAAPGLAL